MFSKTQSLTLLLIIAFMATGCGKGACIFEDNGCLDRPKSQCPINETEAEFRSGTDCAAEGYTKYCTGEANVLPSDSCGDSDSDSGG